MSAARCSGSILLSLGMLARAIVDPAGAARAGVEIRPSPGKGLGAFTTRTFVFGERVGSYDGEVLTEREWNVRFNKKGRTLPTDKLWLGSRARRGIPVSGDYVLAFGHDAILDAEDPEESNWCRYINHGRNPNLGLFREPNEVGDESRVAMFYVISDVISAGDELSFDYGPSFWEFEQKLEV